MSAQDDLPGMPHSDSSWLTRGFDRLLPAQTFPPDDHRRRLRASFVLALASMQVVASASFALTEALAGHWVTASMLLLGAMLPLWPGARMRRDGNVDRWSQVFVANMVVLLGLIHLGSGGRSIGVVIALPTLLLIAGLVSSRRQLLFWGASIVGLMLLGNHLRGLPGDWPIPIDPVWAQTAIARVPVLLSVCVLGMALMLRVLMDRIYADLAQARANEQRASAQARQDHQRFVDFADIAADWFWETDSDLRLRYVSPSVTHHTGLQPEDMLGQHPVEIMRARNPNAPGLKEFEQKMARREPLVDERLAWRRADGELSVFRNLGRPHRDSDGRFLGYRGAVTNITETWRLTRELERLARTDPLTGLLNRRAFAEVLSRALAEVQSSRAPWWLLQLDLDHFKAVNDAAGHAMGDRVLLRVSDLLGEAGLASGSLARVGGDEFCALLRESDAAAVGDHADVILAGFARFEWEFGHRIGASIGIVRLHSDRGDEARHLQWVDEACYRAKRDGGGRVIVE